MSQLTTQMRQHTLAAAVVAELVVAGRVKAVAVAVAAELAVE
jgi:hypothetical protein